MKLIAEFLLLLSLAAGCGGKEDYISSKEVLEVSRKLFPGINTNSGRKPATETAIDSIVLAEAISEIMAWINSDSFRADYEFCIKSKSYTSIDNKLNEIVRSRGYSSFREFQANLANNRNSRFITELSDSLKVTARLRLNKIGKDLAEKNK